ncbi:hypothetical protein PR048_017142 [Dryococelus australis]|uniref:Uncharacterized protein n=1 Tax=Dryococelus australis TaxID=614101 RepID=A0ABQ9H8R6_9NEOP|nr:hypothetical protein PR048_017142 [Dryococelus australis]
MVGRKAQEDSPAFLLSRIDVPAGRSLLVPSLFLLYRAPGSARLLARLFPSLGAIYSPGDLHAKANVYAVHVGMTQNLVDREREELCHRSGNKKAIGHGLGGKSRTRAKPSTTPVSQSTDLHRGETGGVSFDVGVPVPLLVAQERSRGPTDGAMPESDSYYAKAGARGRRVLNNEASRADEGEAKWKRSSAGMQGWGEPGDPQVNLPTSGIVCSRFLPAKIREQFRRESNPVCLGGGLSATPPRPHVMKRARFRMKEGHSCETLYGYRNPGTALPLTTDSTSPGGAQRTRPLQAGTAKVGAESEPHHKLQPVVLLSQNWLSEHETPRRPWCEVENLEILLYWAVLPSGLIFPRTPAKMNRVRFPGGVAPGSSYLGIVPDDTAGQRIFSGISRSPALPIQRCFVLTSLHPHQRSRTRQNQTSSRPHRRPPRGRLDVSAHYSSLEPFCLHCELVLDAVGTGGHTHTHLEKASVDAGEPLPGKIVSSCDRLLALRNIQGHVTAAGNTPVRKSTIS